jgi:hypothetical protein
MVWPPVIKMGILSKSKKGKEPVILKVRHSIPVSDIYLTDEEAKFLGEYSSIAKFSQELDDLVVWYDTLYYYEASFNNADEEHLVSKVKEMTKLLEKFNHEIKRLEVVKEELEKKQQKETEFILWIKNFIEGQHGKIGTKVLIDNLTHLIQAMIARRN